MLKAPHNFPINLQPHGRMPLLSPSGFWDGAFWTPHPHDACKTQFE